VKRTIDHHDLISGGSISGRSISGGSISWRSITGLFLALMAVIIVAAGCSESDDGSSAGAEAPSAAEGSDGTAEPAGDAADEEAADAQDDAQGDAQGDADSSVGSDGSDDGERGGTAEDGGSADEGDAADGGGSVEELPLPTGEDQSELVVLQDDPYVAAAVYPRPDYEGNPWSVWGQGLVADNGRVLTAMGDHLGIDGNSYLFAYDPDDERLVRYADVQSIVGHTEGSTGYGKVHGQFSDVGGDEVYLASYYGRLDEITFDDSYQGDVLMSVDPDTLETARVGVPVPEHGIPSLVGSPNGLLYGEAVDPKLPEGSYPGGGFFAYDPESNEVRLFAEDERHHTFRNVIVDGTGAAWFATDGGGLFRYSPDDNEVALTDVDLGGPLRASTTADSDGVVYGVTDEPYQIFSIDADGTVNDLGNAPDYTASVALTPDESAMLYVPGAHGDSGEYNTPLIAVDTETGDQRTVVELQDLVRDELGLVLGGTYSLLVDAERELAYVTFNAGATSEDPWGEAVLVVVGL